MPSRMGPGDCLVARAVGGKPWAFYPRLELPLSPVSFLQSIQRHFNFNFGQHLAFLIKNVILPKTLTVLAQVCLIIAKTLPLEPRPAVFQLLSSRPVLFNYHVLNSAD